MPIVAASGKEPVVWHRLQTTVFNHGTLGSTSCCGQRDEEPCLARNKQILGIVIAMFYNDHNPPHFHARYADYRAVIAIETGEVIEGRLPPRALGLVQEWLERHKGELSEDWNLARERKALKRIQPLE
jgi:Domain of unknown function (DUF4160)